MAEPLERFFDEALVGSLADTLSGRGHDGASFVRRAMAGLDALRLLDRGRHLADAMRSVLPEDDEAALGEVIALLGPPLAAEPGAPGMSPFRYLPHSELIARLGPERPSLGLTACRELTRRFTAEFCLRPFLARAPTPTWEALFTWVTDPDAHVRRLVSEGTRPRLPWAPRIAADPRALPLLEALRDDPSLYVRRSVANHLGDLAKDDGDAVVALLRGWRDPSRPERAQITSHALRTLVKRGHTGAIEATGFDTRAAQDVVVDGFTVTPTAPIGGYVDYHFTLENRSSEERELIVDAVVTYVKATGKRSPKVFKLAKITLAALERRELGARLKLADLSTRKHTPGTHHIALQLNGDRRPGGAFELTPADA